MRRLWSGAFRQIALQALIAAFLAATASAQPFDLETPADSPAWWTLDPNLSPEDLRAALLDPAGHRARHSAAAQSGRAQPEPNRDDSALTFFVDPSRNPELISMPLAFILFAVHECVLLPDEVVVKRLVDRGMTEAGAAEVAAACRAGAERNRQVGEASKASMIEVQALKTQWFDARGRNEQSRAALDAALQAKDIAAFQGVSDRSREELARLLEVAGQNPPIDVAVAALPPLRNKLSVADWSTLRLFLLERNRKVGIIMDVQSWRH